MSTNTWIAIGGIMSAVATCVMAIFTVKLYSVNKAISDLTQTVNNNQQKSDHMRDNAIWSALDFRLRTANSALRAGIDNPTFFIMWCLHEWDWDKPPVAEMSRVLTTEQVTEVLRAYEVMSLVVTSVAGLTMTLDRWGGPSKWFTPLPNNPTLKAEVRKQVERALPLIEKARKVCGFPSYDELLSAPKSDITKPN